MQYINEEITNLPRCGAIGDSKDTKKRKKAQGNNHIDKKHLCLLSGARSALVKSLNPKAGTARVTTQYIYFTSETRTRAGFSDSLESLLMGRFNLSGKKNV